MDRKSFYDKWYMLALVIEKNISIKGWTYIGSGKNRRVWRRKNVVIKIAYNESGVMANKTENDIYHCYPNSYYAPCRVVKDNILMMRYVQVIDDLDFCQHHLIPNWALNLNDGPQVGMDLSGNILAYDYAEENITVAV